MSTGSSTACPFLFVSLAFACSLTRLSAAHAEEPLLFWQEGDALTLNQEPWQAGIGWKLSFAEEPHDFNAWELKPKVHRRLQPWLAAAATYKFARSRNAPGAWMNTHVMELDLAPSWQVRDRLTLQFTQRLAIAHPPSGAEELSDASEPWRRRELRLGCAAIVCGEGISDEALPHRPYASFHARTFRKLQNLATKQQRAPSRGSNLGMQYSARHRTAEAGCTRS